MLGIRKFFTGGFRFLKEEVLMLFFAISDARTPLYAKLISILALVYLLSPIDLIPDIIPFVGYLDDLVIVPLLLNTAFRLLPVPVKQLAQQKATKHAKTIRWVFWLLLIVIIGLMMLLVFWGIFLIQMIAQIFTS